MFKHAPTKKNFWFLPLGGSGEIGMNLNLYGHDGQWLMVDLGVTFGDRLGIDIITPDPAFIVAQQDSLVGLVLTHAHEDHVGAVPYLWPQLRCPVYATPFTATILRQKLKELPWGKQVPIHEIPISGSMDVGKFHVEYITLTHSIPEPNALAITTPLGTVMHTGDWKIDPDPMVGEATNHQRLTELGDRGILAMVCDSTNVFTEGYSGSEKAVREELTDLVGRHPDNRVVVACFASNVARLETAALAAQAHGRQAALVGRSLIRMEQAARANGYLKDVPPFVDDKTAMSLPRNKVLFIMTGSQGEPRSALARIASNQHPAVELKKDDVVIFSSRVIPGNEKSISLMQNSLIRSGLKIVTAHEEDIHVSGHPAREELKQMYAWVRPEILIPVHGEARHMQAQADLALECGVPQVVVPHNGTIIELDAQDPKIMDTVETGRLGLDGNRMVPMNSLMLRDRFKASANGVVVVTVPVDRAGNVARQIHITEVGVCQAGEERDAVAQEINLIVRETLTETFKDDSEKTEALRVAIRRALNARFTKKPLTSVHLVMV